MMSNTENNDEEEDTDDKKQKVMLMGVDGWTQRGCGVGTEELLRP